MIVINMNKAREIKRDMIRQQRAPLLAALDIEFTRALEQNDSAAAVEIAERKQALRDSTRDPAIEAAQTPEQLKAVVPAALR